MAKLFKLGCEPQEIKPLGKSFTLKELQGFVNGYIELVTLGDGTQFICNEEGKLKNLTLNSPAMTEAKKHGWTMAPNDYMVGNILFLEDGEIE